MKITNLYNLPETLVQAIRNTTRELTPAEISMTQIIDAPQVRCLRLQHWNEIEEDVSDMIWSLFGTLGHALLEAAAKQLVNHLAEEKLTAKMHGVTVTGTADLLTQATGGYILDDYKFTSVWVFVHGGKEEWAKQLNGYCWLYRKYGFNVKEARIIAVLRDWKRSESMRSTDYPSRNVYVQKIPIWPEMQQETYLSNRVLMHKEAWETGNIPPCTPEEMWEKPTRYAVKKKGNKRAAKVFDTMEQAEAFKGDEHEIEVRPGGRTRCEEYCSVSKWCPQYQAYLGTRDAA
jgi:hypothetical protein